MTVYNLCRFIIVIVVQLIRFNIIILIIFNTNLIIMQFIVEIRLSWMVIAFGRNCYLNVTLQFLRSLGRLPRGIWLLLSISVCRIVLIGVEQFTIIGSIFGRCVSPMAYGILCDFWWAIWFNNWLVCCWSLYLRLTHIFNW